MKIKNKNVKTYNRLNSKKPKKKVNQLKRFKKAKIVPANMLKDSIEQKMNRAIINNFSDGLIIFDNENKVSVVNIKAKEYLNISGPDYFYRKPQDIGNILEMKELARIVGNDIKIVVKQEFKINPSLVLEVSVQEYSEKGIKYGKFLILHDITFEKRVQLLKSEFVAIVAHQLKTPLSAVKWALTSISDGDFGELNDNQKKYLGKTIISNDRMINLVDDLLNLSKIEAGKYVQIEDFLRVEDLVKEVLEEEESRMSRKNMSVIFNKDNNISEVSVDKQKIKLVIQNLVENAISYGFDGTKIDIGLTEDRKKHEVQFKISNIGIEISEESKKKIFTKFFRSVDAISAEIVGSGLGLFINKSIIESHGGKIWFDSKGGKETIFYFSLPVKKR